MAGMNDEELRDLERRSRAAFDASVESTDAATRSRLSRARARALAGFDRARFGRAAAWTPAGAVAVAVVAALLWRREDVSQPPVQGAAIAYEDLDIVTGGEDFGLLGEDADFVAWAAGQLPDGVG
jgi:hypothetical protein